MLESDNWACFLVGSFTVYIKVLNAIHTLYIRCKMMTPVLCKNKQSMLGTIYNIQSTKNSVNA